MLVGLCVVIGSGIQGCDSPDSAEITVLERSQPAKLYQKAPDGQDSGGAGEKFDPSAGAAPKVGPEPVAHAPVATNLSPVAPSYAGVGTPSPYAEDGGSAEDANARSYFPDPGCLYSQPAPGSLSLRPVVQGSRTFAPGGVATFGVMLAAGEAPGLQITEELQLPAGWQSMFTLEPFVCKDGREQMRLFAVAVSGDALAGVYEVGYRAYPTDRPDLAQEVRFPLQVQETLDLAIAIEEQPGLVIAGETCQVPIRLINQGNTEITVRTTITSSDRFPVQPEQLDTTLGPFESRLIPLSIGTPENLGHSVRHYVRVASRITNGGPETREVVQNVLAEVLPQARVGPDPRLKYPVELTLAGLADRTGEYLQASAGGSGYLDEARHRRLEFLFQGPDRRGVTTFGKQEEYWARYQAPGLALQVGDHYYRLSRLSSNFRYGRGASLELQPGARSGVGLHYAQDRDRSDDWQWSTYVRRQLNDWSQVKVNYLEENVTARPGGVNRIASMEADLNRGRPESLQLEAASQTQDGSGLADQGAYRVLLSSERQQRRLLLERIYAGPAYQGFHQDYQQTSGLFQWRHNPTLRSHVSMGRNAYVTEGRAVNGHEQGGVEFQTPDRTVRYTLEGRHAFLEPHEDERASGYDEISLRAGVGTLGLRRTLNAYLELGKQQGYSRAVDHRILRASVLANFILSPTSSLFLQGQLSDPDDIGGGLLGSGSSVSGSLNLKPWHRLRFSLRMAGHNLGSRVRPEHYLLDAALTGRLTAGLVLDLRLRQLYWPDDRIDTSFLLALTRRVDIPTIRKTNVGSVRGRVFVKEDRSGGLVGVIVRLNDLAVLTDEAGEFHFPAVEPGPYRLSLDQSSLGLNRMPELQMPMTVIVRGGRTEKLEIGVVKVAGLRGTITRYAFAGRDTASGVAEDLAWMSSQGSIYVEGASSRTVPGPAEQNRELVPRNGLANVLIELSNGGTVLRKFSNVQGIFEFSDLVPGVWTLHVSRFTLPAHHDLEATQLSFELKPDQVVEIDLRVVPRLRTIRILERDDLSSTEADR